MKRMLKIVAILFVVLFFAVLLKPNYASFKTFAHTYTDTTNRYYFSTTEIADYLVYSVYGKKIYFRQNKAQFNYVKTEKYSGYLMSFHLIPDQENE